jgi:hypothetical protein
MSAVAEIIPSARYVAMATDAAKELLGVANRVHGMGKLRRAPIRWIVRIVHATVFLLKSVMLSNSLASKDSQNRTITTIQRISATLLEASPDDIHLASRYGTILGNMCAQLTAKKPRRRKTAEEAGFKKEEATAFEEKQQPSSVHQHRYDPVQDATQSHHQQLQPHELHQMPMPHHHHHQFDMAESDGSYNLMSMLDVDFDFLMEGTEGLGFVEPLMEGIEQQQWLQQKQDAVKVSDAY